MSVFQTLCEAVIKESPTQENIDRPYRDIIQESWLTYLEQLKEIPNVETFDELVSLFEKDAGLLTTIYRAQQVESYRATRGEKRTPHKAQLLESAFSLDGFDENGTPWKDIIEDNQSELPFRHIEDLDLLHDPRISSLTEAQQAAIKRFIVAWCLIDNGYTLPKGVKDRIYRDRKLTGLPLVLPKGSQEGGRKDGGRK